MNETTVGITFKNSVNGNNKLEKLATNLTTIQNVLSGLDTSGLANLSNSANGAKNLNNQLKDANSSKKSLTQAADIYKLNAAIKVLVGTVKTLSKYVKQSSAYLENLNLFENAFGADYKAAEKFTNKLSEMYGLDESWVVKTTGNFKQLANAMGIAGETGTKLSELLTNMSLDISSLYNIDVEDASSKLQSALAGQTKPVRSIGADITESTLQTTLGNLGIDKTVSELSYAEKRLVIIISLTQQLNTSIGDMGRTIEMPANQMRVLSAQWERLTRAVGNLFLPIVKKVLPYLNAILMVLTEIISAIATLFGYDPEDYNVASTTSSVDDLVDSLDNATDSASNLKKQMSGLRSFDKLNNITTPSSDSSSTSTGSSSGINTDILDAFNDAYSSYNDKLADVSMKATKIRDSIMEWLGFTKEVDEETGKVSFKFSHITGGTVLGALVAGGVIAKGVFNIYNVLKKIGLLKFPLVTKLVKAFGGSSSSTASSAVSNAGSLASTVKSNAKAFDFPSAKTMLKGMADLAIIVGGTIAIVEAVGLLTKIKGFKETATAGIQEVSSVFWGLAKVSPALVAMGVAINTMGKIGVKSFALGLADLAIIIGGTVAVVEAIGLLFNNKYTKNLANEGISVIKEVFNGIADLSTPLIAITAAFALMGLGGGAGVATIALGLADFAIILAGTVAVVEAVGLIFNNKYTKDLAGSGLSTITNVFNGIYDILVPLELITALITVLGFATPATILSGLAGFALIIGGIEAVLVALGALRQIDGFSWIVGEGGKVLSQLGGILGNFAGSFVEGFANMTLSILDDVGTHLTNFITNAKPFFESVGTLVTADALKATSNLVDIILKLSAAELIDSISSWFGGDVSLVDFGKQLADFAPYLVKYAKEVKDLDTDVVEKSATAATAIAEFASKLPNQGGVVGWFMGENNLSDFSECLPNFGKNLKKYADNVKGLDSSVVTNSTEAASAISEFSKNLPNQGGMLSWFVGDNTIDKFSEVLPSFGKNLKKYSDNVKGIDASIVTSSADAAKAISELSKNLPNQGGLVSWFTGDNTLDKFGETLYKFGKNFKNYANTIKDISLDNINNVTDSISKIVTAYKKVKDNNLTKTVDDFTSSLSSSSKKIKDTYSTNLSYSSGWDIGEKFGEGIGKGIVYSLKHTTYPTLKLKDTSTGSSMETYKLSMYASGGLPPVGQLFVANEKGPELVGQIGGQSFVANQNQMLDLIDKKIGNSSSMPSTFNIYVGDSKLTSVVVKDMKKMAKNNGQTLDIFG